MNMCNQSAWLNSSGVPILRIPSMPVGPAERTAVSRSATKPNAEISTGAHSGRIEAVDVGIRIK